MKAHFNNSKYKFNFSFPWWVLVDIIRFIILANSMAEVVNISRCECYNNKERI